MLIRRGEGDGMGNSATVLHPEQPPLLLLSLWSLLESGASLSGTTYLSSPSWPLTLTSWGKTGGCSSSETATRLSDTENTRRSKLPYEHPRGRTHRAFCCEPRWDRASVGLVCCCCGVCLRLCVWGFLSCSFFIFFLCKFPPSGMVLNYSNTVDCAAVI